MYHLFYSFIYDFQAPLPVKAYAKNLIEGIISDTITQVPISDDDDLADQEEDNDKCNINEETDVSLSLETDTAVANTAGSTATATSVYPASVASAAILAATSTKSPSSHVETDSLDESEHAGQHSWIKNEQEWTWINWPCVRKGRILQRKKKKKKRADIYVPRNIFRPTE